MLIAVITRNKNTYFCKRIKQEISKNNKIIFINPKQCLFKIQNYKTYIFYKNKYLKKIDLLIPRISSNKQNYLELNILKELEKISFKIINNYKSIKLSNNKLLTLKLMSKNKIKIPKTIYILNNNNYNMKYIEKEIKFPMIVKSLNSCQGKKVFLIKEKKKYEKIIKNLLKEEKHLLIQEFIIQKYIHDIRCIVFENKVIATMKRVAKKNKYRSNIYQGGTPYKVKLSKKEKEIAIKATKKIGLKFSGVDIIRCKKNMKPILIEVNSTPGIKYIEKITKKNIIKKIIQ